ncbi:MAG: TetR/AcrR family transcriptional regulator [Pseudomonadota bacterium]
MTDTLLQAAAEKHHPERKQLQRIDWLQQALAIFVAEGIDAVRITRLAEDLQVTRGSFYWHFENRQELIAALVDYWKRKNTPAITQAIEKVESLEQGILQFFEICVHPSLFDPRLDLALREWARRSDDIRLEVDREDNLRIKSIQTFFARFDYPLPEALIRARVLYFSTIGFYALEVHETLETRLGYTESYYECFTGKTIDLETADGFRQHILGTYGAPQS